MAAKKKRRERREHNISALIRTLLKDDPDAKPAHIVRLIEEQTGEVVSPQYVSTIKSGVKKRTFGLLSDSSEEIQGLLLAKQFIQASGGAERAKALIDSYLALTE